MYDTNFIPDKDIPDKLISADAVSALVHAELDKVKGDKKPGEFSESDHRLIMCLNRIGADVNRLKFGQEPIYSGHY